MSPPTLVKSPPRRRRRLWWGLGLIGWIGLGALDRWARPALDRALSPVGGAEWIWSHDSPRVVDPRAFYLARDFDLEEVPSSARVVVQGDEEYILTLNGVRVGSNRFVDGAVLDVFPVAELLVVGGNRFVVELRSSRGAGGFMFALESGAESPCLLVSDASWSLLRQRTPGLLEGWGPLAPAEPVRVWGPAPTGRWGRPRVARERVVAGRSRGGAEAAPLVRLAARPRKVPLDDPALPSGATFDFGREVTGYLELRHDQLADEIALVYAGSALAPRVGVHLPVTAALVPGGATVWQDSVLRTLRFVRVLGWSGLPTVEILEIPPEEASRLRTPPGRGGLLGVQVPWRPTPPDHRVWRRLRERGEL